MEPLDLVAVVGGSKTELPELRATSKLKGTWVKPVSGESGCSGGSNTDTLFEGGSECCVSGPDAAVKPKLVVQTRCCGPSAVPKPDPFSPPPENVFTGRPGAYGSSRKTSWPGQTPCGLRDQVALASAQTRPPLSKARLPRPLNDRPSPQNFSARYQPAGGVVRTGLNLGAVSRKRVHSPARGSTRLCAMAAVVSSLTTTRRVEHVRGREGAGDGHGEPTERVAHRVASTLTTPRSGCRRSGRLRTVTQGTRHRPGPRPPPVPRPTGSSSGNEKCCWTMELPDSSVPVSDWLARNYARLASISKNVS